MSKEFDFINTLNFRINSYLKSNNLSRYSNAEMKLKIVVYCLFMVFFYCTLLNYKSIPQFIFFYLLCGITIILATINIAHDAAHQVLFEHKTLNNFIFYILFQLTGYNPDIWKENHVIGHHTHPNIKDIDPHFPETPLIRYAEWQKWRWFHRYQIYYVPILYCIHSIVYFFIEEPMIFLNIHQHIKLTSREILIGLAGKLFYFTLFFLIPIFWLKIPISLMLILFLVSHIIVSIIMTLVIGINHLTTDTLILEHRNSEKYSWAELQIRSTVDFSTNSKIASWLIGGFNIHTLHHLFPSICHTHYRNLMPIYMETLKDFDMEYHENSFIHLVISHFKYLKKLGYNHG